MKGKEILLCAGTVLAAGLILFLAGTGLASTAEANAAVERQAMMQALLPGGETFTAETYTGSDENITAVWRSEGGWIVETTVDGYAGPIRLWTGVDDSGSVTGLVVRDLRETFGLGRKALTDIPFLSQFLGTRGDASIGESIDAISGATVTSRAIARGVNSAAAYVTGADVGSAATEWGG